MFVQWASFQGIHFPHRFECGHDSKNWSELFSSFFFTHDCLRLCLLEPFIHARQFCLGIHMTQIDWLEMLLKIKTLRMSPGYLLCSNVPKLGMEELDKNETKCPHLIGLLAWQDVSADRKSPKREGKWIHVNNAEAVGSLTAVQWNAVAFSRCVKWDGVAGGGQKSLTPFCCPGSGCIYQGYKKSYLSIFTVSIIAISVLRWHSIIVLKRLNITAVLNSSHAESITFS